MSPTSIELHGLKRADVQKLCKILGIKGANQKTEALIGLILQHYANSQSTTSEDEQASPAELSSVESGSSGAVGEGITSAKTGSNSSLHASRNGRSNSRLLQPTASSRAKKMMKQTISQKPSTTCNARPKKEAGQPVEATLPEDQEEPMPVEAEADECGEEPDDRANGDEAMEDGTVPPKAARPEVLISEDKLETEMETVEPTSSPRLPSTSEPVESIEAASSCVYTRSSLVQPSDLLTDLLSVRTSLAELTARVDGLPTREETELNKRSVYDALACTDATVEFIGAEIMVFGRMSSRAERLSVKKEDIEAMVDQMVESRLKLIEQSFASRLKTVEDRLEARLCQSQTCASQPEAMKVSDLSLDLERQSEQVEQVEQVLGKRARNTIDMSAPVSPTLTGARSYPDRQAPATTSSGLSDSALPTSIPSSAAFSMPVSTARMDATGPDDHRQKRSRVVSLAISEMEAGDIEDLLEDVSGEPSAAGAAGEGDGRPLASTNDSSIKSSIDSFVIPSATVPAITSTITSASLTPTGVCRTPLLMTARSAAEPARTVIPLPSALHLGLTETTNGNDRTPLPSPQVIVASTPDPGPVNQPGDRCLYPSFVPSDRQTVQSLLPPVPVDGPFWMSPMAPSRQLHRPTSGSKQETPKRATKGAAQKVATPFTLIPMGTHNIQLGPGQDNEIAPPTPPGPKTMFGTEKETFGRLFSDEMTPWMP